MVSVPNSGPMPASESQPALEPIIHVTKERVRRPCLAPDVELVGRMQDTAFDDEQWLICFDESTYIQSTPLLYHVLLFSDGTRTAEEIAGEVVAATGIEVTGEDVEWLVMNRLIPSGLLDLGVDEEEMGEGPRPAELPVLGLRWRIPLFPYEWTAPLANLFARLYWPPLMVAVFLAAVAINVWLFIDATVIASAQELMFRPEFLLVIFALDLASTLFHELGHAAALRRAGAKYGWIGAALYVIFPVFYTDVTHVYRLNRWERIRVDLGGMYFELVMTVVFFGLYHATGNGIFLIAIVLTTLSFLQQFTPFLRFDGYYTIADIMGVHEPLSIVKPFLRDQIPWPRNRTKSLPEMRTGPRIALWVYLLAIVAFLSYPLFIGAFAGRQFAGTLLESGRYLWNQCVTSWSQGEILFGIVATLQLFFWALIPLGLTLFAITLIRHFWMAGDAFIRAFARLIDLKKRVAVGLRATVITFLVVLAFVLLGVGQVANLNVALPWVSTSQPETNAPVENVAAPVVEPPASEVAPDAGDRAFDDVDPWRMNSPPHGGESSAETRSATGERQDVARRESSQSGETSSEAMNSQAWFSAAKHDGLLGVNPAEPAPEAEQPVDPGMVTHVVEQDETLWMIAERYGTTAQELVVLNEISNPNLIVAGQTLEIPQ